MPHHSLTMQGLHNCVEKNMQPWILLLQLLVTPCWPQPQSSWTPHLMIDVAMDFPYWEEVNGCFLMPHHSLTMQGLHNCMEKKMWPWILLLQLLVTPCWPQPQSSWTPHLMIDVAMDSPYWEKEKGCVFWCLITVSLCKGCILAWRKICDPEFCYCNY